MRETRCLHKIIERSDNVIVMEDFNCKSMLGRMVYSKRKIGW